jgi:hypothetical protein
VAPCNALHSPCLLVVLLLGASYAQDPAASFRLTQAAAEIDGSPPDFGPVAAGIAAATTTEIPHACHFSGEGGWVESADVVLSSGGIRLVFRAGHRGRTALEESTKAAALLAEAISSEASKSAAAKQLYAEVRALGQEARSLLSGLIVGGHRASVSGAHAEALAIFTAALRLEPGALDAVELAAVSLQQLGLAACAEAFHRRAMAQDPSRPRAHVNLGLLLLHAGRPREARGPPSAPIPRDPTGRGRSVIRYSPAGGAAGGACSGARGCHLQRGGAAGRPALRRRSARARVRPRAPRGRGGAGAAAATSVQARGRCVSGVSRLRSVVPPPPPSY